MRDQQQNSTMERAQATFDGGCIMLGVDIKVRGWAYGLINYAKGCSTVVQLHADEDKAPLHGTQLHPARFLPTLPTCRT